MRLEILFTDGRKDHLNCVESFRIAEEPIIVNTVEIAKSPIEGKLFEVNPLEMDRSLFKKPREDTMQEWRRQLIQEAFTELDKHPEEYATPFYTMAPKERLSVYKTPADLEQCANDLGGQMADWVYQSLEWAQRICNGESWESFCNLPDTSANYRMVRFPYNIYNYVGGSSKDMGSSHKYPSSMVWVAHHSSDNLASNCVVPLVVFKKN